jgi:hypothetical protein
LQPFILFYSKKKLTSSSIIPVFLLRFVRREVGKHGVEGSDEFACLLFGIIQRFTGFDGVAHASGV